MFASGGCRGRGIRGGFRGLFFGLHARLLRRYELRDVDGGLVVELFFFFSPGFQQSRECTDPGEFQILVFSQKKKKKEVLHVTTCILDLNINI